MIKLVCDECGKEITRTVTSHWVRIDYPLEVGLLERPRCEGDFCSGECLAAWLERRVNDLRGVL